MALDALKQDLAYAVRRFRREPSLAAPIVGAAFRRPIDQCFSSSSDSNGMRTLWKVIDVPRRLEFRWRLVAARHNGCSPQPHRLASDRGVARTRRHDADCRRLIGDRQGDRFRPVPCESRRSPGDECRRVRPAELPHRVWPTCPFNRLPSAYQFLPRSADHWITDSGSLSEAHRTCHETSTTRRSSPRDFDTRGLRSFAVNFVIRGGALAAGDEVDRTPETGQMADGTDVKS